MIMGMTIETFTILHTAISLIGIASGFVVMFGLLGGKQLEKWTGFLFPVDHLLPSHKVGILSLVVLAVAIPARYFFKLAGGWRRTYVLTAVLALYLNVFVLVVQLFLKVPVLKALAPTQQEPPFLIVQVIVLALFIWLAVAAVRKSRNQAGRALSQVA